MTTLRLAPDLALPIEAVTESLAVLAIKRAGKSYLGRKLTEQLYRDRQQVVIVDPKGDWWGIRSAADGKNPGLPIVILGGEHGDVPLEVGAGELVARMVVTERVSVLLDLAGFRKHQVATFMTDFLETLYHLKAKEEYRTAMMLVIDEADAIAPQRPMRGEERMLGAAEDIVRRGGQRGIGIALITQRAAVLNKNVLSQCGILIFLRTLGLQDIDGVDEWIKKHGQPEQKARLMADIASLPRGHAWVWAPGWPDENGIFQRIIINPIETFDSGATPKPGERRVIPKTLADVDLDAFRREMASTIEKAKAEDPKALRARIAELERGLKAAQIQAATRPVQAPKRVEISVLKDAQVARLEKALGSSYKAAEQFGQIAATADAVRGAIITAAAEIAAALREQQSLKAGAGSLDPVPIVNRVTTGSRVTTGDYLAASTKGADARTEIFGGEGLSGPEQRILDVLAWLESVTGVQEHAEVAVAFLAGYTVDGGAFKNPRGKLHGNGLIAYVNTSSTLALTPSGRAHANRPDAPLTTEELHRRILARLPGPERKILSVLLDRYPKELEFSELATAAGYEVDCGAFKNPRGRLRSLGLIEFPQPGYARARAALFLER